MGTNEFTKPVINTYINRRKAFCIKDSWCDNPMSEINYPCSYRLLVMEWKFYKNYPRGSPKITSDMKYILLIRGIFFCNGATNSGQDKTKIRYILPNEPRFSLLYYDGRMRVWREVAVYIKLCNHKCNHELSNHEFHSTIMHASVEMEHNQIIHY